VTACLLATTRVGKHEVWRILVLSALFLEIYLTRRLVKSQRTTGR
jgi:hypothetical protein